MVFSNAERESSFTLNELRCSNRSLPSGGTNCRLNGSDFHKILGA